MKKLLLSLIFFALGVSGSVAQVKLCPIFSDNMVLQQKTDKAPIWGECKPGKTVTITTSWNNEKQTVTADKDGKWKTTMHTPSAGGPYTITIAEGKKKTVLNNVMIGEVWLCSGQSNMEMPVEGWGHVMNWEQEKAAANHPNIRLLFVEHTTSPVPASELNVPAGGWQVCTPDNIANFSACGYFFGRALQQDLNVPIGLIDSSWGGTLIEPWTSAESLATCNGQEANLARVAEIPADPAERETAYKQKYENWVKTINTLDEGFDGDTPVWALANTDMSSWKTVQAPGYFDEQQDDIKAIDGFLWIRKTVDIPASMAGKELTICLGRIDDNDITFFNGECIGSTIGCGIIRHYTIPAKLVKAGKNIIATRIQDTGGLTGIVGVNEEEFIISLKNSDQKVKLTGDWQYHISVPADKAPGMPVNISNDPNEHTVLYNAMIHPFVPYTIKGAIWYQGESNASQGYQYRELMPLMIKDWRSKWGYEFPFFIVQLANYMARQEQPAESSWAELREAQLLTRLHLENVGMATIIDIGEANDIHPKNKQEVGRRLSLAARSIAYGERLVFEGPVYSNYRIEGNTIRLQFQPGTARGMKTSDGKALKGFAIAGLDRKWHWAEARIVKEERGRWQNETIVVSCPEVPFPVAVRYAWADNPECNLVNGKGLPASPFRTDDWPGVTFGNRR